MYTCTYVRTYVLTGVSSNDRLLPLKVPPEAPHGEKGGAAKPVANRPSPPPPPPPSSSTSGTRVIATVYAGQHFNL